MGVKHCLFCAVNVIQTDDPDKLMLDEAQGAEWYLRLGAEAS